MEGLRTTHDSGCCLQCYTNDIIIWLLSRQHRTSGLRMETQHHGFCFLRMETVFHNLSPNTARSTELGNLFQNIVMCIPEEGQAASKVIYIETCLDRSFNVGNT